MIFAFQVVPYNHGVPARKFPRNLMAMKGEMLPVSFKLIEEYPALEWMRYENKKLKTRPFSISEITFWSRYSLSAFYIN